ncbi:MAG: hypothetical protein WA063_03565 [Minisyncoccia bacterium]
MITKTNLDAKLSQIEERMERKMDFKISQAVQKREAEIAKLKTDMRELKEKVDENKEVDENRDDVDARIINEIEFLKEKIEKLKKIIAEKLDIEIDGNKAEKSAGTEESDVITPDEI